ncbi:hypothetical protein [uncultured Zobellia sp.]|uniref:hypothetical protein n=1 Tax=uncultured Zobellia sp. TaxID=255433 RepID=UPI002599D658|nr:hypothetical protein [uncultured Zobellia sp.]
MRLHKECVHCNKELEGRTDKKFCDSHCRSAYQYKTEKQHPERFYNQVDNQLKLNRKLLKEYNKGGKVTIRSNVLLELGFNPNFFTHYWKNQNGQVYFFIYEYGFLIRKENGKEKYVLILWQDYMAKNTKFTN